MKAFVLVSLDDCDERLLLNDLRAEPSIKSAHFLFGEWDIIAEVDVANPEALAVFVMERIRRKQGVKLTSSLIVASNE